MSEAYIPRSKQNNKPSHSIPGTEVKRWAVADKLRGNVEAAEYKNVMPGKLSRNELMTGKTRVHDLGVTA